VEDEVADPAGETGIVHHVADGFQAREMRGEDGGGVGAVEDADFPGAVRFEIFCPDDVQAGFVERNFVGDFFGAFDDPEVEVFAGDEEFVVVAEFAADARGLGGGEAGDDAVNERVAEIIFVAEPRGEFIAEFPGVGVLEDDAAEVVAVAVNEFARQEDEAGQAALESFVEEDGDFCGERFRRTVGRERFVEVRDAGFGGVGDDEADGGLAETGDGVVPLFVRIQPAADGGDEAARFDGLAALDAAEEDGVEAVLLVEQGDLAGGERLDDGDAAVEESVFVEDVEHPVGERAEEVAFAELDDTFRKFRRRGDEWMLSVERWHGEVVAQAARGGKELANTARVV